MLIQDGFIAHIEKRNSIVGSEDVLLVLFFLNVLSGKPLFFLFFLPQNNEATLRNNEYVLTALH